MPPRTLSFIERASLDSGRYKRMQCRQVHLKSGFAVITKCPQLSQKCRSPAGLPVIARKLPLSTQYGHRIIVDGLSLPHSYNSPLCSPPRRQFCQANSQAFPRLQCREERGNVRSNGGGEPASILRWRAITAKRQSTPPLRAATECCSLPGAQLPFPPSKAEKPPIQAASQSKLRHYHYATASAGAGIWNGSS